MLVDEGIGFHLVEEMGDFLDGFICCKVDAPTDF